MKMKEKSVVKDYIDNTLKKPLTFTLKEKDDIRLKGEKGNKDYNKIRYLKKVKSHMKKKLFI